MKPTRRNFICSAAGLLANSALSRPSRAAAFEFKLGVNVPETHPLAIRLVEAAKAIGERTAGQLTINVFPNSQLGGDPEMLSQVRSGVLELLAVPSMTLSTVVPVSGLPSVAYGLKSYDQVWAAMDGAVGDIVRSAITQAGLVAMKTVWDNGFRQITSSSRQINTVEDLNGFKIRVPVTAILTSAFTGLGAAPTSISFNELYSALQTRVVDGQENPLALIDTAKLYEVQKYCTISNHCWSGFWLVGNRRALESLPSPLRGTLEQNFNAGAVKQRDDLVKMDQRLQAELKSKGMTFNAPDAAPFRAALQKAGFYLQWQKKYGSEAWAKLEQYTGALI
jgi:TRAP-type transport system periplasmic protein